MVSKYSLSSISEYVGLRVKGHRSLNMQKLFRSITLVMLTDFNEMLYEGYMVSKYSLSSISEYVGQRSKVHRSLNMQKWFPFDNFIVMFVHIRLYPSVLGNLTFTLGNSRKYIPI